MTTRRPRGFTLLELVVVLGILAVLTGIAVQQLGGVQEQSRFDQTRAELETLRAAVTGSGLPGDTPGFVADTGRLPFSIDVDPGSGVNLQPAELWTNAKALAPFDNRIASAANISSAFDLGPGDVLTVSTPASVENPAVRLSSGWRSTLRLPVGRSDLVDGWGNAFRLLDPAGAVLATPDQPIGNLVSLGADGSDVPPATEGYNAELGANWAAGSLTNPPTGFIAGEVVNASGTAQTAIEICLYVPDPSTGLIRGVKLTQSVSVPVGGALAFKLPAQATLNGQPVALITPGPRVIVAKGSSGSSSRVQTVHVLPGGVSGIQLELR